MSVDRLERGLAVALVVVGGTAWAGLILAEASAFSPARLVSLSGLVIAAGCWLIWRERSSRGHPGEPVGRWHFVALAACTVGAALLVGRAGEPIVNGADGSVYLNIGHTIERTGSVVFRDALLDVIPHPVREALFERDPTPPDLQNFFPGGFQVSADGATVQPGFFHLAPAASASLSALFGPKAGYLRSAVFGVLSIVAVWLLARRITSPLGADIAAVLLTINIAQVWFARFPTSEVPAQFLVLAGLLLLMKARADHSSAMGLLGGWAFGLAALTRLEVVAFVIPLVCVYLLWIWARSAWTPALTWFTAALALTLAHVVVHAAILARPYTERVFRAATDARWLGGTTLVPLAIVLAAAVALTISRRTRVARFSIRGVAAVVGVAVLIQVAQQLGAYHALTLFTPVGLGLMCLGAALLATRGRSPETMLLVGLLAVSALVYTDAANAGRFMPMAFRRFVPVMLPLGLVCAAHAVATALRERAWRRWLGGAAGVFLVGTFARHTYPLATTTSMAGLTDTLRSATHAIPRDAVVLTDRSLPSHLGLSLHYTIGQPALSIRATPRRPAALAALRSALAARGVPLVFAVSSNALAGALDRDDFAAFAVRPMSTASLEWTELERTLDAMPSRTRTVHEVVEVYAVESATAVPVPLAADIGAMDFNWRGFGFHGSETAMGTTMRWTSGDATVHLPAIRESGGLVLTLRAAAPRPAGHAPVTATVTIGDTILGSTSALTGDFQTVSFEVPSHLAEIMRERPTVVRLQSPTFVPATSGLGADDRSLGIAVDELRLDKQSPSPISNH